MNADNDDERKFLTFRKVLFNFFTACHKNVFLDFLCSHVAYLLGLLDAELRETNFEVNCANKRCVFELLELAYKRLHRDEIFSSSSRLCAAYETSKFGQVRDGKELTKEVLKKCRKFLCDQIKFVSATTAEALDKLENRHRQLHCAAYNCLAALFIRTQKEPRLYSAFLFKDDASRNEFVFEPLVSKTREYKFSIEIEVRLFY